MCKWEVKGGGKCCVIFLLKEVLFSFSFYYFHYYCVCTNKFNFIAILVIVLKLHCMAYIEAYGLFGLKGREG